jgi:hypothetical protein
MKVNWNGQLNETGHTVNLVTLGKLYKYSINLKVMRGPDVAHLNCHPSTQYTQLHVIALLLSMRHACSTRQSIGFAYHVHNPSTLPAPLMSIFPTHHCTSTNPFDDHAVKRAPLHPRAVHFCPRTVKPALVQSPCVNLHDPSTPRLFTLADSLIASTYRSFLNLHFYTLIQSLALPHTN